MSVTIKDYQDWLKNNKSVKVAKEGEKLSTFDEQENRALYEQYVKEAQLYNDKQAKDSQIDLNEQDALRDNYIAQAQAQKGANEAMRAARMTTGLSESSLVDLYSQGAQARANIIKESDAKKADLLSLYKQDVAAAKINTNSKIAEIDALRQQDEEAKTLEETEKNKLYASSHLADLLTRYDNEEIEFEELQSAYETLGAHLDEVENYDVINAYKKHAADAKFAEEAKNTPLKGDGYDINVHSAEYKSDVFGNFLDTGKSGSKQEEYLKAIVEDAKNGKIPKGAIITPNYGYNDGTTNAAVLYEHIGDGKFKKITTVDSTTGVVKKSLKNYDFTADLYVPEGYEYINNGWDRTWGTRRVVKK